MRKFMQSGGLFFVAAALFLVAGALSGEFAIYLPLGVVWFILGIAARKRNATGSEQAGD